MASELEPQVVQVVLPDGDVDVRLASLDNTSRSLVLQQVNLDNGGEIQVGGKAVVKLSSIGHVSASGKIVYLRAGGPSGPVLLELQFDSGSVAQSWAEALEGSKSGTSRASPAASPTGSLSQASPKQGGPSRGRESPRGAGAGRAGKASSEEASDAAVKTLRELVRQQEEQVRLLEQITSRKDSQLLKMQERLEDSLNMLQVGQAVYGRQQRLLEEQQKNVNALRSQLQGADSIMAACSANASTAAAGKAAAKGARVATATAKAKAVSPGGSNSGVLMSASPNAKSSAASRPAPANNSKEDEEAALAEQQALLSTLYALQAEKGQAESQLQGEQQSIFAELRELQSIMAELGVDLNGAMAPEA
jgi:hypothetical protein